MWWLQFEVTEYNRKNTPGYRTFITHNFRDTAMTRAWDANISVDKAAIALGCHLETMKKHYVVNDRMAISDDVLKRIQGQRTKSERGFEGDFCGPVSGRPANLDASCWF